MSQEQEQGCANCAHLELPGHVDPCHSCRRLDAGQIFTGWQPRADALRARQEPAGAPIAVPAIPAQQEAGAGAQTGRAHGHYFKDVRGLDFIDVYRVLSLFGVADPCIQHAVKKLLVAGGRGSKDQARDVQEAIDTLERWHEMREEEGRAV